MVVIDFLINQIHRISSSLSQTAQIALLYLLLYLCVNFQLIPYLLDCRDSKALVLGSVLKEGMGGSAQPNISFAPQMQKNITDMDP